MQAPQVDVWLTTVGFPSPCPLPITPGGRQRSPEGHIVQAHTRQHDQDAVPQHPLVVFVLLLPRLRSLRPHTMKLGPILCIGGFPGAAGRGKKGSVGMRLPRRRGGWGKPGQDDCTCVLHEQTRDALWLLETLEELLSRAGDHSCGGSALG